MVDTEKCHIPCKGIYADVSKIKSDKDDESNEDGILFTTEYEDFKRMFEMDPTFGRHIEGKYIIMVSLLTWLFLQDSEEGPNCI